MSARRHTTILRCASLLVPHGVRSEWLAEWRAELWYLDGRPALRFCLGAFRDAFWMRRNLPTAPVARHWCPASAGRCLLLLTILAAVSIALFLLRPPAVPVPAVALFLVPSCLALAILAMTTSFALGEYPAGHAAPPASTRLRRWFYLAAKAVLLVPIVFCGTLDLCRLLSASPMQPHGLLLGMVLAVRWALKDQRERCPVCLRRLTHPARIGMASQTFLEWYGTELICERGHGLLHVPEVAGSCYGAQQWTYLDPSWRVLF